MRKRPTTLSFLLIANLMFVWYGPDDVRATSFLIDSVGDSTVVPYSFNIGGGNELTATGTFNAVFLSSTETRIQITIANTTNPLLGEKVTALGFNTNPAVTASLFSAGSYFDGVLNNTTFPGFQQMEVCAFTSANCSSATNPLALPSGGTDTFTLRLLGSFGTTPSLTLDLFVIRFAGEQGSFTFEGGTRPSAPVPEPSTVLLLSAGLLGLGLARTMKRSKN